MEQLLITVGLLALMFAASSAKYGTKVSCKDKEVTVTTDRGAGINNYYVIVYDDSEPAVLLCKAVQLEKDGSTGTQKAEMLCNEQMDSKKMVLSFTKNEPSEGTSTVLSTGSDEVLKSNVVQCSLPGTVTTEIKLESSSVEAAGSIGNVESTIEISFEAKSDKTIYVVSEDVKITLSSKQSNAVFNLLNVYTMTPDKTKLFLIEDKCPTDNALKTEYTVGKAEATKYFTFKGFIFKELFGNPDKYEVTLTIEAKVCGQGSPDSCDFTGACSSSVVRRRRQVTDGSVTSTNETGTLKITVVTTEEMRQQILKEQAGQEFAAQQQLLGSSGAQPVQAGEDSMCANKTVVAVVLTLLITALIFFFMATLFLILRNRKQTQSEFGSSKKSIYSMSSKSYK